MRMCEYNQPTWRKSETAGINCATDASPIMADRNWPPDVAGNLLLLSTGNMFSGPLYKAHIILQWLPCDKSETSP